MSRAAHQSGFSLIEMAIVMVIIGLLLGGLLTPLTTQREISNIKATQEVLDETMLAILGYAYSSGGELPCPDTDFDDNNFDGFEDQDGAGACDQIEGVVPWATLGTSSGDSFSGNRIGYRLGTKVTDHSAISCDIGGTDISICTDATCASQLTTLAWIVIWSHGKNGWGAINAQDGTNQAPTSTDELFNVHSPIDNNQFVKRIRTDASSTAGEFDDMIEYRTGALLCAKMVEAGVITP